VSERTLRGWIHSAVDSLPAARVGTKFLIGRSEFDRWLERDRYVKEQMGHSSIQVTVDVYGHLIPGANTAWADALDSATSPQQSATQTQPTQETG